MSYDHWKTTNPEDEYLGPDPFECEEFEERESLRCLPRVMDDEPPALDDDDQISF